MTKNSLLERLQDTSILLLFLNTALAVLMTVCFSISASIELLSNPGITFGVTDFFSASALVFCAFMGLFTVIWVGSDALISYRSEKQSKE